MFNSFASRSGVGAYGRSRYPEDYSPDGRPGYMPGASHPNSQFVYGGSDMGPANDGYGYEDGRHPWGWRPDPKAPRIPTRNPMREMSNPPRKATAPPIPSRNPARLYDGGAAVGAGSYDPYGADADPYAGMDPHQVAVATGWSMEGVAPAEEAAIMNGQFYDSPHATTGGPNARLNARRGIAGMGDEELDFIDGHNGQYRDFGHGPLRHWNRPYGSGGQYRIQEDGELFVPPADNPNINDNPTRGRDRYTMYDPDGFIMGGVGPHEAKNYGVNPGGGYTYGGYGYDPFEM